MLPRIKRIIGGFVLGLCAVSNLFAQRPVQDWVRDGVIYEIYPRAFSQHGNFNGITARLDELKDADSSDWSGKEEGHYRQPICRA
jgi:hypothetical protein